MKNFLIVFALLTSLNLSAKVVGVYNTAEKAEQPYKNFLKAIADSRYIVLGEFHYDLPIQEAEGQIIQDVSALAPTVTKNVMWEFLNVTDQQMIDGLYNEVMAGKLTSEEFILKTLGDQNAPYASVISAARETRAGLIALNLPREQKQKVIKEGIQSIDPKFVPASHYLSGKNYYDRFVDSMGGHVPAEKIQSYYVAQCLVDSVMSDTAVRRKADLNFLVAGSFHTDFFDGTVEKIKKLDSAKLSSVKIINLDSLSDEEKTAFENGDEIFGTYADYLVFVRGE